MTAGPFDDDPFFGAPRIHRDTWHDAPVRHRRVRGSFAGTDTRFCFCFPERARYGGRFLQFLGGGTGGDERQGVAIGMPLLAFEQGAYYVESNQGHRGNDLSGLRGDGSILEYRASAEAARFARRLAREMYGEWPHHGYVIGPSGGAMRAVRCLEEVPGLWHGAVPWMLNRTPLHQFHWSLAAWAGSLLGAQLPAAVAALERGDLAELEAALSPEQREALAVLHRGGYPRGAEDQLTPNPLWLLGLLQTRLSDPDYFEDFWRVPGHAGAEASAECDRGGALRGQLVEHRAQVAEVVGAGELSALGEARELQAVVLARTPAHHPVGLRLEGGLPAGEHTGATLRFASGARAGERIDCSGSLSGALLAAFDPRGFADVRPGDALVIDNRDLLAFTHYHRHLIDPRYPGMRQFFDAAGAPRQPRRPIDFDRLPTPRGRFEGKMILLQHTHDRECWPICAEAYARDVRTALGDAVDARFRLYWIERAAHLVPLTAEGRTRLIDHSAIPAQATRDLIAWVEHGQAPPASTRYRLDDDGALQLPLDAHERGGIQPVVRARVNGAAHARVGVGEPVTLQASAEVPPGAGGLVSLAWDLDGSGAFALGETLPHARAHDSQRVHRFARPGRHAITVRVASERDAGAATPRRIQNLARVGVEVEVVVC